MSVPAPLLNQVDFRLDDVAATGRLAARLARLVQPGDVIGLKGELGAGKTTFARFLIRARAASDGEALPEVPSPTFTLVQIYALPSGSIWHFDLLRVDAPAEAIELGLEDAFAEAISLIEWPERLRELMPPDWLEVRIEQEPEPEARRVRLIGHGLWEERLAGLGRDD